MAQVNTAYDDVLLAQLDAIAAGRAMSRPDLFRAIAEEAVRAHEQGRSMFEPPPAPIDPATAMSLAGKVEQLCVDLDRLVRSWDKREKKLIEAFNATEEANRTARERLGNDLFEHFRKGTNPYAKKVAELGELIAEKQAEILAATRQPESLALIRKDMAELKAAIRRSRRVHNLHLGTNWGLQRWQIAFFGACAFVALLMVEIGLALLLPYDWLATPLSLRLFGSSDTAICEMLKLSRGLEHCPVLVPSRPGGEP